MFTRRPVPFPMFTRRTLLSHGLALLGGVRFLRDLTKAIFDPPMIYTFQEEFDGPAGSAPDPSKWRYDLGRWADNDELETYTDSRANSYLDGNGNLVIKAIKVTERGGRSRRVTYTSARLQTQDTFSGQQAAARGIARTQHHQPGVQRQAQNIEQAEGRIVSSR